MAERSQFIRAAIGSALTVALAGCMSDRAARELGEAIAAPLNTIARQIAGEQELMFALAAFHRKNNRWPKDYVELSNFVSQSDGFLQLSEYDRVDFAELPEGGLEVVSVNQGLTNRMTFTPREQKQK